MVCRGRYYDKNGDCDHSKVLVEHVKKISEIAKKYDLELIMWSDMFYRLASGNNDYYDHNVLINEEVKKLIPDNVNLIYWDYYFDDKEHYDGMIKSHKKIKDGFWFAGVSIEIVL